MCDVSDRTNILNYVAEKYEIKADFPWDSSPDAAVLRHSKTKKWFALIMNVSREKLHLNGEGSVDVLNVKCDQILIGSLRKNKGFLPAYHMNKEKWLTVVLDGSVPEKTICDLIDLSFDLT